MSISKNLHHVQQEIAAIAKRYARPAQAIRLVGVSKGQPPEAIMEAFKAGLCDFGENYWQEARNKLILLKDLAITWHFIGAVQSNKTADIAAHFDWVHCVNSEKVAKRLAEYRPETAPPLNICIQINLDAETTKSGIKPDDALALAKTISAYPRLKLRGLMAIPKPCSDEDQQYQSLQRLTRLSDQLNQQLNLDMDTLSMGMSDDISAAIHAGSTLVRIGRAIFGERQ